MNEKIQYEEIKTNDIESYSLFFRYYTQALGNKGLTPSNIGTLVNEMLQTGTNSEKLLFGLDLDMITKIKHLLLRPYGLNQDFEPTIDLSFKLDEQNDYLFPWINFVFKQDQILAIGGPDKYSVTSYGEAEHCPLNSEFILAPSEAVIAHIQDGRYNLEPFEFERKIKETLGSDCFKLPEDIRTRITPLAELPSFLKYAGTLTTEDLEKTSHLATKYQIKIFGQ